MKHANLDSLRAEISNLAKRSVVGMHVKRVSLEADDYEDGSDYLRVLVEVDTFDGVEDADLEALMASIETAVGHQDERFASVRFSDAA